MNPKLSLNSPVVFSQPLTGTARKRSSFEQSEVSSQASAQPRSCGSHWQSQHLMAAPLSAKSHCVQPDPSPPQPYPDSGSKALFNQFIEYVKTLYRSCPIQKHPEVLKLKTPGKMFINLAFIDRKTKGLRTEYDEITEAMVRDGNVDVIQGRKCPIYMNEIAANLPKETLEKVILVEGAPGVGKSTFAWEFCRRWERGEIAQQYDLVLLLRLRDDRISKAKCLKDLIHHHSEEVREAVVSELESCLGVNVLLLLEGYDELPDDCRHRPSLFLELINGQVLPLATVLITSRPWATCDVRRKFEHRIFQHIEVLGFTKEQITAYISNALSEPEALDLEESLQKQSKVRMCMYIPLNCAIVVTVYLECKANGVALPTTLSGLYEAVCCTILLRYLRALKVFSEPFGNLDNLPAAVKNNFYDLCQLAYDSITGAGDQVKLIFTDLPEDFDGLGFMDSVYELYETRKTAASHNFLHLTFQEFLAAVYISNMEAEQRLQHFKRHKEDRLRVVLRFLAGITKLKDFSTPSSFVSLLDQPGKFGYTVLDYSISCYMCTWVHETARKEIIRTIFTGDITVELVCHKPIDFAALGYFITHSHCKWILSLRYQREEEEIDILIDEIQASDTTGGMIVGLTGGIDEGCNTFNGLSISLKGLNRIFTGIRMQLSELALDLPAKCSEISWPDVSSLQSLTIGTTTYGRGETMNWELDYLLRHLSLSSLCVCLPTLSFSLKDNEAIVNYITKISKLKELYILESFEDMEMKEIFAALRGNEFHIHCTLDMMCPEYDDIMISNSAAKKLANYIRTTALSRLIIGGLLFSAFGALQVARAVRDVPDLIADKLSFYICEPSDFIHAIQLIDYFDLVDKTMQKRTLETLGDEEYLFGFSFLLPDSTTVEWGFSVNDGVGIQCVAEAVCNNSKVKALKLCNNFDVGAEALAEVLNCNCNLEELDLSSNNIGDVRTEALAQAIASNTSLKQLVLSDNGIGDVGAKALAEVLNCNTVLEELDLSWNKIGSVGTEALAQVIGSNSALKELDLSVNDGGDVGAIALAQALHSNSSLKVLKLPCNCIGDSGAKTFAEALHHNSTITHLDLCGNEDIGEEGVHHLIQALTVNDSISENGLTLDEKGSECMLNCLGYINVKKKIHWW